MLRDRIRAARPDDIEALAALHVASWKAGYRGLLSDEYLDLLTPGDRIDTWTRRLGANPTERFTLVSTSQATPAAPEEVAGFGIGTTVTPGSGTVEALYVDPAHWRGGHGRALLAAVERGLADRGCTTVDLWVLDGNARAIAFYEACGYADENTARTVTLFGITVLEHRFARSVSPAR